jgi:biotin operon repressor
MTRPESDFVSGEELARWLGLSGKEVYDLGKAGVLIRVGRAYRLEDSVRRYCEHLRQTATTEDVGAV